MSRRDPQAFSPADKEYMMRWFFGNGGSTAPLLEVSCVILTLLAAGSPSFAQSGRAAATPRYCDPAIARSRCSAGSAPVFTDHVDHARHRVVAPNDIVSVDTWGVSHHPNDTPPSGGFRIALQDIKDDGHGT
jgi:hypothetical protein